MKITNKDMAAMMLPTKITKFADKIIHGTVTFDDCGLDSANNFLSISENVFISDPFELEKYCTLLCAECPQSKCAIFTISNEHHITFALKLDFNDFDYFDLDDSWYCWNLISFAEEFRLEKYGLLCEISSGEWKTIVD